MGECRSLLSNVTLQNIITYVWLWGPNVGDGHTVCGVYQMLMRHEMHNFDVVSEAIWHKIVPLKIPIFVWRLLRNRWPTKDNLVRRSIIPFDYKLCVSGCGNNKSADHHLIHCPIFGMLWHHVKTWIGVYLVNLQHVLDHFIQFSYSSGGFKHRRLFLQLIWLCSVLVLWNERNHRLFSNNAKSTMQLLEKVKITSL